jgi:hypothetical protein
MNTTHRNPTLAIAFVLTALAIGSNWFWAARVRQSDSSLTGALRAQAGELARLSETVSNLQATNQGLAAAIVLQPAGSRPSSISSEQLDRISSAVATRINEAAAPPEPPEPTPETTQAASTARNIIDAALREKRWTATNAREFRAVLAGVNADDRSELQRRLAVAINNHEVDLDLHRN